MVSSLRGWLGAVGIGLLAGCHVSVEAEIETEYVDRDQPAKTTEQAWAGQTIAIENDGVNPLRGTGGIEVVFDANATHVTAQAIFSAQAKEAEEENAKASIRDAIGTFVITETSDRITVACGHGGKHGSSDVASSGCKKITVTVPAGSETSPLSLAIGNGIGDVTFTGPAPVVSRLEVNSSGVGDVKVYANPTVGADVLVIGQNVVDVGLPSTLAADEVHLVVNAQDAEEANRRILVSDFPGLEHGSPFGATGTGLRALKVESKGLLDSYTLTIRRL